MSVRCERTSIGPSKATLIAALLVIGTLTLGCKKVEDAATDATESVKDAASDATEAAGDAAEAAGDAAQSVVDSLGEEFTEATNAAKSALESVDGGGEIMTKMSDLFSSAHTAIHDVADGETAQAAASKLDELTQGLDGMADMTSKLPEEARTAVSAMVEKGIAGLKALTDKIDPTISSVVKPKLDALVDKLKSL